MTAARPELADYSGLAEHSKTVAWIVKIRDGDDSEQAMKVYAALEKGLLDQALQAAKGMPTESEIVRQVERPPAPRRP